MPLRIDNSSDYLAPSALCIKTPSSSGSDRIKEQSVSEVKVHSKGSPVEEPSPPSENVKISLNDCLACSGCITSSETVLVQSQSTQQFIDTVKSSASDKQFHLMITISEQSLCSFAAKYQQDPFAMKHFFHWFFNDFIRQRYSLLNQPSVHDLSTARSLSLRQTSLDLLSRISAHAENNTSLPLITGSCPGWVCFAEKLHGDWVLPHICRVKSPQQIMGSLVKSFHLQQLSRHMPDLSLQPSNLYHVCVMPCFDKKLEASREDFYSDVYECRDVDLVLATFELEDLIQKESDKSVQDLINLYLSQHVQQEQLTVTSSCRIRDEMREYAKESSGGYLLHAMKYLCQHKHQIDFYDTDKVHIRVQKGRNLDYIEYKMTIPESSSEYTFLQAYGFRNIQNIIRQFKMNKLKHIHFIEVMACPSGCINGGGQLRPHLTDLSSATPLPSQVKELVSKADSIYHEFMESQASEDTIENLWNEWSSMVPETQVTEMMYTDYHNIQSNDNASSTTASTTSYQW